MKMENLGLISQISSAFANGGIWMYAILLVQIVSIAIMAERAFTLYVLRSNRQMSVAKRLEDDIRAGRIDAVLAKTEALGTRNPVAVVTQAGAQAAQDMGGREEIQSKMDEVLLKENARLDRRTGFLSMLGNVATLLGLLGTIVGLIQAFASVSNVNPVEKASLLTQGIAMAMNTTAYGLIVAIPALVAYSVLQNRANSLNEDLNQASLRIYNWLSFHYDAVPAKTKIGGQQ